eukprot:m.325855 g.325855  ORF g.325855 m.325855 type:complete len:270 (-) comp20390_c0_seq4:309-1118(-)
MAESGKSAGVIPQAKKKQLEENARSVLVKEHGLSSDDIKSVTAKIEFGNIVFDVHFNDIDRTDVDNIVKNLEIDGLLGDYTLKRGRSSTVGYTDDELGLSSALVNEANASDFDHQRYDSEADNSEDDDSSDDDSTVMSESTVGREDPADESSGAVLVVADPKQTQDGGAAASAPDVAGAPSIGAAPIVRKPLRRDSILDLDANNEPMQQPSDDKVWRMPSHGDDAIDEGTHMVLSPIHNFFTPNLSRIPTTHNRTVHDSAVPNTASRSD